jgi:hypothetical protein
MPWVILCTTNRCKNVESIFVFLFEFRFILILVHEPQGTFTNQLVTCTLYPTRRVSEYLPVTSIHLYIGHRCHKIGLIKGINMILVVENTFIQSQREIFVA